jgi:hypothetical protein
MFDASAVCRVRFSSSPLTSFEALRELKELIRPREAVGTGEVIQAQHQSLSHKGGSDAKPSEVTPSKLTVKPQEVAPIQVEAADGRVGF